MSVPLTLADVIRRGARLHPERPAIVADERRITYRELDGRSSQAANALVDLDVERGDRVAFLSLNRVDYYELMLGAAKVGAVTVPVNWRLAPSEVAAVLADAEPRLVVVESELLHLVESTQTSYLTVGDWAKLVSKADDGDPDAEVAPDDVMWQLYTSGTTGLPKGVMLMHQNLMPVLDGVTEAWHFDPGCVVYMPYPAFHAVGTAWPVLTMHRGGTVLLRRSFDAADFVRTVDRDRVTLAMMVPAVLNMVLTEPEAQRVDLSSLRHIVYGAAPISQAVLNRAIDLMPGCAFHHAYGLTESTGMVTTMQWPEHEPGTERMRSCGRPLPWVDMQIVDPATGEPLPTGAVGEVWMRGPTTMKGYHRREEETRAAFTDGWLHTGDAGYVDDDGYLYLTDRVKDMIISGGENIYPAEVENVLYAYPGVREAAAIGIPDERWGETVLAVIVPRPDAEVDPAGVVAFCREHLGHYKCPSRVEIRREPLPLNATGKVLRRELREPYWQSQGGV